MLPVRIEQILLRATSASLVGKLGEFGEWRFARGTGKFLDFSPRRALALSLQSAREGEGCAPTEAAVRPTRWANAPPVDFYINGSVSISNP